MSSFTGSTGRRGRRPRLRDVVADYQVPGTKLSVFADAAGGSGTDALDVLIYGWKE
jgi:hypothetical protein